MKPYNERLWDAYCAKIALGDSSSWELLLDAAKYAVDYFDAHCPREEAPTTALDRAVKEREDALWASPAPNWRALVENLKRACEVQNLHGDGCWDKPFHWKNDSRYQVASEAVSALIAALDKPEGEPTPADRIRELVIEYIDARQRGYGAEQLALVNLLNEVFRVRTGTPAKESEPTRQDDFKSALHQLSEMSLKLAEANAALEATRRELAEARDALARALPETRKSLGAPDTELTWDAARRVVAERNDANLKLRACESAIEDLRTQRDELRAKLAAQDELRDAAVEYVEADMARFSCNASTFKEAFSDSDSEIKRAGRAGLRYLAAKDAAAKNGGV